MSIPGIRVREVIPPRESVAEISDGRPLIVPPGSPTDEERAIGLGDEICKILLGGMLRGSDGQLQAVEQVCAMRPDLNAEEVDGWMQALALEGLPEWLKRDFWTPEMDQILLAGIREGVAGEIKAVGKIVRVHPELRVEVVWARVRHLRARKGRKGRRGRPFEWASEIDAALMANCRCANIAAAVSGVQKITGYPRDAILRRARKLGVAKPPLSSWRPWKPAELRFLAESVQHLAVRAIAKELHRSEKAVWRKVETLGLSAKCGEGFTAMEVMTRLHISHSRLRRWVDENWIKIGRNGRITERSLRSFLREHREELHWGLFNGDTFDWLSELGIEPPEPKAEVVGQTS
jgi:hypothetical protein